MLDEQTQQKFFNYVNNDNDLETVKQLLAKFPQLLNEFDKDGNTALHTAVIKNNDHLVNLLISKKCNINIQDQKHRATPLHFAVIHNHIEATKLLIEAGADLNAKDKMNLLPQEIAKIKNHNIVFGLLIAAQAKSLNNNLQTVHENQFASDLSCLFQDKKEPEYIWYADKPPKLGGIPKKLPIEEFNKIIGDNYHYTENIYISKYLKADFTDFHNQNFMEKELLEIIKHPLNDKLVICYMGADVGHGVFARDDIGIGEIIGIYSGEIKIQKTRTSYSLDLDPERAYSVDATQYGGIARFFQHLPLSVNETINKSVPILKQNSTLLQRYIKQTLGADNLFDKAAATQSLKRDILDNNGQNIMKRMFLHGHEKEWQIKRLQFKNSLDMSRIATSNLTTDYTTINEIPVAYLWAERDIQKNEQLGFDYGFSYWTTKQKLPLLFDHNGNIILEQTYTYQTLPFVITTVKNSEASDKDNQLNKITLGFFKEQLLIQWKTYPENRLTGKYIGHQVRFFTMAIEKSAEAKNFCNVLKQQGFDAELKSANNKPSVVVDLTLSK